MMKFQYCECGCKGYSNTSTKDSYWIYWDLKNTYYAVRGHGFVGRLGNSQDLGKFKTLEEAKTACENDKKVQASIGVY